MLKGLIDSLMNCRRVGSASISGDEIVIKGRYNDGFRALAATQLQRVPGVIHPCN